jgi:hypothetical protein
MFYKRRLLRPRVRGAVCGNVDPRWNLIRKRKEYIQKGLPPLEETTARERCLAENCEV